MHPIEEQFRADFQALLDKYNADYEAEGEAEISIPATYDHHEIITPWIYITLDRFMYPTRNTNEPNPQTKKPL